VWYRYRDYEILQLIGIPTQKTKTKRKSNPLKLNMEPVTRPLKKGNSISETIILNGRLSAEVMRWKLDESKVFLL